MKPVSKEVIRGRLLRNAAHFWGQENTQNLDPFATLLMEALSTELYKAYNEIQTTESRILEKMARLLTPELYASPRPAHGIAHLRIREAGQTLNAHNQFYTNQRIATREEGLLDAEYPLVFTPLADTRLIDGDIQYIAAGDRLSFVNEARTKVFSASAQTALPPQHIYLGLEVAPSELPSSLTLFLRFNLDVDDWMYSLLPSARWSVGGQMLQVRGGFARAQEKVQEDEASVFADYETMTLIESDIRAHHQRHFLTVTNWGDCLRAAGADTLPTALLDAFPHIAHTAANRRLVWMEVAAPSYFTPELLDHLYASVNAFPVVNRRLNTHHHVLRELNKIVPIVPGPHEHFLSVAALTDDRGRTYQALPFQATEERGYYSVKYGGAERFDERDAQEYLSYLSELLRDEVAAFSAYGKDFVQSTVTDLGKKIRLIKQKAHTDLNRFLQIPTYLMVEPIDAATTNLEVQYWITNSTLANTIRAGTELLRLQTSLNVGKSPVLLTHVGGGRNQPSSSERLSAYKYTLTTRNRLVTYDDIKSFCHLYLGERIRSVDVCRGVSAGVAGHHGLIATTDIILTPSDGRVQAEEWSKLQTELKAQIAARSPNGIFFRVLLA